MENPDLRVVECRRAVLNTCLVILDDILVISRIFVGSGVS